MFDGYVVMKMKVELYLQEGVLCQDHSAYLPLGAIEPACQFVLAQIVTGAGDSTHLSR